MGETGSGKTTQVPQYILEDATDCNINCRIICTQPRRLSALAVADRVAFERDEETGNTVGFQIRLESKTCPRSNLIYCTNGILVRCLMAGNNRETFKNITHVIIDEVHERDKNSDFLLISLREALREQPNLKLILMSATIDAQIFSKYFDDCPQIFIPGKTFEVQDFFLEDVLRLVGFEKEIVDDQFRRYLTKHKSKEPSPVEIPEKKSKQAAILLDPETVSYLNDLLEKCLKEDDEDNFNQFLFMVDAEDVPVDYQHTETELTILMVAAARGMTDLVQNLLQNLKANPEIETKHGLKAVDLAQQMNHAPCVRLLNVFHTPPRPDNQPAASKPEQIDSEAYINIMLETYNARFDCQNVDRQLITDLVELIHVKLPAGSILVFLPGYEDIIQINGMILDLMTRKRFQQNIRIYMLHSNMKINDQKSVFKPAPFGSRKIILSTNIAETSITIDDVVYVIDSGKVKQTYFDAHTGSTSLDTVLISKACGKQRAGRAGRVMPGICYRMYSRKQYEWMEDFTIPELLRVPLTEICLSAKLIAPHQRIEEFLAKAVMPPFQKNVEKSIELLKKIGALDESEKITSLGIILADLPVDAHLGKMIIYSIVLKCVDPVLTIVSALSVKSIFSIPGNKEGKQLQLDVKTQLSEDTYSDHLVLIRVFQKWLDYASKHAANQFCIDNFLNSGSLQTVCGMRSLILGHLRANRLIRSSGKGNIHDLNHNSKHWAVVKACIMAGLYPNICQRENSGLVGQHKFKMNFHQASVLNANCGRNQAKSVQQMPTDWVVYEEKVRNSTKTVIDCNTVVTPQSVALFAGSILLNENALIALTDELDSDDEEDEEEPDQILFKINDWISFKLDQETAYFMMELRQKFNGLLLRMLHNHDHFHMKMDENDNMTLATMVEVLIAEDVNCKLSQPPGIGDRPQAVYLDFSADVNFGIQEAQNSVDCAMNGITKDLTSVTVTGNQRTPSQSQGKKTFYPQNAISNNNNFTNRSAPKAFNPRFFLVQAQSRTEVKKLFNRGPWTFASSLLNYLKETVPYTKDQTFFLFFIIQSNQEVFGCGGVVPGRNCVHVNRLTEKSMSFKDVKRQMRERRIFNFDWNQTQELDIALGQLLYSYLRP